MLNNFKKKKITRIPLIVDIILIFVLIIIILLPLIISKLEKFLISNF